MSHPVLVGWPKLALKASRRAEQLQIQLPIYSPVRIGPCFGRERFSTGFLYAKALGTSSLKEQCSQFLTEQKIIKIWVGDSTYGSVKQAATWRGGLRFAADRVEKVGSCDAG